MALEGETNIRVDRWIAYLDEIELDDLPALEQMNSRIPPELVRPIGEQGGSLIREKLLAPTLAKNSNQNDASSVDVTRRTGRPSRRLPQRPHRGPPNTTPGWSTRCLDHQRQSRTSHSSRHWFKGSQRGCGAPFRAWRFAVTTRSSTTTRRPARGSRTGRSTAAQPSFSPQQAIARSARSRLPAFAACGASRAARISRTSARTFSRPRPSATIASSNWL